MRLSEVKTGSEVEVQIEIQDQPVTLKTKSQFAAGTGLVVDRIMIGDGDLIWRRPCKVTVHNAKDGNTYLFDAMSIEPAQTQMGSVHRIVCEVEGEQKQMRVAQRIEVVRLGNCFVHGVNYKAIIYDISESGVAVILDGNVRMKIGDEVTIRFSMTDPGEVLHVYELTAQVVRFFDVQGRVAIGCRITGMPDGLMWDINLREQEKMFRTLEAAEDMLFEDLE
jgi:hypothetical protein